MLHIIKLQGNKNNKDVANWFKKLFPESHYRPDRFVRKMERVVSRVVTLSGTDSLMDYLATPLNLDSLSPALDKCGITLANVFTPLYFDKTTCSKVKLTNQIVIDLELFRSKERLCKSQFIVQWLLNLLHYDENDSEYNTIVWISDIYD